VTVLVPSAGVVITPAPAGVSVHKPVAPGIILPSIVTVPLQVLWLDAVAVMPSLLMFTSSNRLHMPFTTVHRKVFTPELRFVTVVDFNIEFVIIPLPTVLVHEPTPWLGGTDVGSMAANVAKLSHMF